MHQAIFGLNLSISVNFEFCQLLEDVFGTRSGISKDKDDGQGWTNQGNHKHLITLLNLIELMVLNTVFLTVL